MAAYVSLESFHFTKCTHIISTDESSPLFQQTLPLFSSNSRSYFTAANGHRNVARIGNVSNPICSVKPDSMREKTAANSHTQGEPSHVPGMKPLPISPSSAAIPKRMLRELKIKGRPRLKRSFGWLFIAIPPPSHIQGVCRLGCHPECRRVPFMH